MARKILTIILILSFAFGSTVVNYPKTVHAMPVLKEATKWTIKEALKKKTKSMVESTIVKEGVRTTEKKALEKANERWFQRLTAEEVAGLEKAVERAVPASTPGWLKTVVGAGMFLTGADLMSDIYDATSNLISVPFYTPDATLAYSDPNSIVQGYNGLTLSFIPFVNDITQSWPVMYSTKYRYSFSILTNWGSDIFTVNPGEESKVSASFYDRAPLLAADVTLFYNGRYTKTTYVPYPQAWAGDGNQYYVNDYTSGISYNYDYPMPQTLPMPSDMQDAWPGESEAVEILFPDPDFFPDTTATVIANPKIITNPIPETMPEPSPTAIPTAQPTPQPTVDPSTTPEPTDDPAPSATPKPSIDPTPSPVPSLQPTTPPVIDGGDPNPTTPPDDEYDEDDEDDIDHPVIDSPATPEEALAKGWEDVTPPLIKEYKDPKTGTVLKFNTKTREITYTKYFGVDIVNAGGKKLGEIDEIDMENKIFYEDKSAKGLYIIPPGKDKPNQTPQEWADHQIRDKTSVRINSALKDGVATKPTPEGSKIVPDIESFRTFREFIFRMNADTVELRDATENALYDLRQTFPDYKFSATFGEVD
ncbi:hypothetical protein [Paenibacillus sp. P32E]|uniref:hypothetical protein n=1 Tax=Paenibacillus sp. P32E TaxID=1349434 RepID=UPI00093CD1F6|nr:hypothetical protein [Paenibacillus sp. P32E]OKP91353.1 hypothetical protein A3848_09605 [Paenibacillus sp. P32E]